MGRRAIILIIMGVLLIGGAVTLFLFKPWESLALDDEELLVGRGNTVGNIINVGGVAKDENWHYFEEPGYSAKLYRIKPGDGKKKLISSDKSISSINIVGSWIYYGGIGGIKKMKLDGTGQETVCTDAALVMSVVDGWAYYMNWDDYYIYKVRVDGTGLERLSTIKSNYINVVNDWIYFTAEGDGGIYKMRTDGTEHTVISEDTARYLNVVDGWMYYSNRDDGDAIYKIQIDGTAKEKICDDESWSLNVSEGWIYYRNNGENGNLYKIRTDGTERNLLYEDDCGSIIVLDDWIYYQILEGYPFSPVYRIRTDGTEREKIDSTF